MPILLLKLLFVASSLSLQAMFTPVDADYVATDSLMVKPTKSMAKEKDTPDLYMDIFYCSSDSMKVK